MEKKWFHRALLSIWGLLIFVSPSFAAILKGVVKDEAGAPLSFATVYVQGSTNGTSANVSGEYNLNLQAGSYTIVCQYIGYAQKRVKINIAEGQTLTQDFVLQEQALEMNEITVKISKEDPAYRIIRKAIAKRKEHLKQVQSFQTGIYLKGVLRARSAPRELLGNKINFEEIGLDSAGKGVLLLLEQHADYYSKLPNKSRTIIKSVKQSGNPNSFGFSQFPDVITFYENNINLSESLNPRGFISPVNDGALNYYKYKLLGGFKEGDYYIYKIAVTPKREFEPLFTGNIYIVEDDWAIHSLDLYLTQNSGMSTFDTLRIEQSFLPLREKTWVIKNQVIFPVISLLGFNVAGNFVTIYDNQKVNEPIPDSLFSAKIVSSYEKDATQKDSGYWTSNRPLPLEEDETKDYRKKDSIFTIVNSPEYKDSVRRKHNRISVSNLLLTGQSHTSKSFKRTWTLDPLFYAVNFNTVEGLNIAPSGSFRYRIDTFQRFDAKGIVRYGFSNEHFNAIGAVAYTRRSRDWKTRYWKAGIHGGKYVFQYNYHNPVQPLYNTTTSLVEKINPLKLYEKEELALHFNQNLGNGFRWNITLSHQNRFLLQNTTDYSWYKKTSRAYSSNNPAGFYNYSWYSKASVAELEIQYQPGYTYTLLPDGKSPNYSNWPVFRLNYEKGIPGLLGSGVDFDKWKFSVQDDLRLRMLGQLEYNLAVGGFFNTRHISFVDLNHVYGNPYFLASPYLTSFQLAGNYTYSNAEKLYGEAHIEYKLKGLITNKIPLFKKLDWHLLTGANSLFFNSNSYYTEVFVGLENIGFKLYRFFRLDFVQSFNQNGPLGYGFRLGISTRGMSLGNNSPTNGEWRY